MRKGFHAPPAAALLVALMASAACGARSDADFAGEAAVKIDVTSPAFARGARIPIEHTGDGQDYSPPLQWKGVPPNAVELALIVDDPDAPSPEPWVHWVLFGLDPRLTSLAAGDEGKGRQGANDFRENGWRGPAPPRGHGVHHYHFKLYALDAKVTLPAGASKSQLVEAMRGHVVAQGELIGTYDRS